MISPLKDLLLLFLPPRCPVCGAVLGEGERTICNTCRWEAPLTGFTAKISNPVVEKFWGIVPIEQGCSFLYFVSDSGWRKLVHDFKYKGMWRIAFEMGQWFGGELSRGGLYDSVDIVIPIPLHPMKTMQRGYNQSEYIARGIADTMSVDIDSRSVIRRVNTLSQALRPHRERWKNVENIFSVRTPEKLAGKHILLVDDVFTTGATITSCAEAIYQSVPNVRISIATLSVANDSLK